MSNPFMAEMRIVSFNYAPKGWAFCNGQFLPINQNQALFALLGTTYGGNGQTTFALPNMRGRMPMHVGNGFTLGQTGGETAHTVTQAEMPQHIHPMTASSASAAVGSQVSNLPAGRVLARATADTYSTANPDTTLTNDPSSGTVGVSNVGGSQAHENMQPYLALGFIIALQGIFPSQ